MHAAFCRIFYCPIEVDLGTNNTEMMVYQAFLRRLLFFLSTLYYTNKACLQYKRARIDEFLVEFWRNESNNGDL